MQVSLGLQQVTLLLKTLEEVCVIGLIVHLGNISVFDELDPQEIAVLGLAVDQQSRQTLANRLHILGLEPAQVNFVQFFLADIAEVQPDFLIPGPLPVLGRVDKLHWTHGPASDFGALTRFERILLFSHGYRIYLRQQHLGEGPEQLLQYKQHWQCMFNNYLEEDKEYESCTVIIPAVGSQGALLIGDFNSVTDTEKLRKHNIRTIITAATGLEHLEMPPGVEHITYPLLDASTENIRKFFDDSSAQIKNGLRNGGVLVHCAAGISRSATLVIAYVMSTRRIGFKEAIAFVRASRNVRPNLGFERQLKMYERQLNLSKQMEPLPDRLNLKKTITDKIVQQRRTAYNRSSHMSRMFNQYLKFDPEPRTADESVRRKQVVSRRFPFPYSQSRPRAKRNFQVRPVGKESLFVMGQAHGVKEGYPQETIGYSEQIKPPLIQNHHRNALNNGWIKLPAKKAY